MNVLCLALLLGAPAPATVDAALIPNYTRVTPEVAVAGLPTSEGLARLKALGFRTVVDLRRDEEDGKAAERAAVQAAGLRYVSVPLTAASLGRSDVDAVAKALADADAGPVLLHCSVANRAGGMWALLRKRQGLSLEDAIAEGKRAGLKSDAMIEAVRRVGAE
jgi:uncharacterized protein (TIGR01244 family)